ncbi:MAG: insulinase family protein [Spirochaetaceae bacterium]|jgi:zinc protease|nr:insulinase family protein [Spirochaetaceae bacterium]
MKLIKLKMLRLPLFGEFPAAPGASQNSGSGVRLPECKGKGGPFSGIIRVLGLAFLLSLFAFLPAVFTAADPAPVFTLSPGFLYGGMGGPGDPVPPKAALRQGTLPNGLRYYILENSLPADRAYLTLAVNAGSVLEEEDEQGLAHFVEHMAFNGTRRFPGAELVNYLRSLGMRFGPEVNAYTSYDETVYGIEVPVEKDQGGIKRIPEKALAILDDWTWTVSFNSGDIEKERSIILEEYRTRLGAMERVMRRAMPVIFHGSRYADRLPIGLPEIIQTVQAEKLKQFYQKWYRPDNMALILVGDFNGAVLEQELSAHFTAPAAKVPLELPRYDLPGPRENFTKTAVITDPELPASIVYLYYKLNPQPLTRTNQAYRDGLITSLIEIMTGFRSDEAASKEDSPFMGGGSWNSRYGQNSRYYIMAAQAKDGRTTDTLRYLLLEKERLIRYGFTRMELDRAKAVLLSNLEQLEAEKDRQESDTYVMELTADFLNTQFAMDVEWNNRAASAMLPFISLGTVNSAIKDCFVQEDLVIIVTAPDTEKPLLPGEPAILTMVRESRTAEVAPPVETAEAVLRASGEPVPGQIVSQRQHEPGILVWELSNGMRMILMETANRNNELDLYALARGGTTGDPRSRDNSPEAQFSAELAAEIQSASGLGPLSRPELTSFLADKQVSLSFWTSAFTRGFQGFSTVKDMETLFQMLHIYYTQPRINETGLSLVLDQYRTMLTQEADNPDAVFSRELTRTVYGNHPLFKPLEMEDLDHVTVPAARAFLTAALNPADYTVVLAGALGDRERLRNLAETWLASIPPVPDRGWNAWAQPEIRRPGKTEKIIRKGRDERSMVYMGWFVPKPWTEEDNAAVRVLSEYLDIILTDKIRETLGGVYSISANASLSPMPKGELSLGIYFICDPKREGELRRAVQECIASLSAGLDEETFIRSKEALVKSFERSMENNTFIAGTLGNFELITNVPLSHLVQRPALYRAVEAERVRRVVADLLSQGPVELVLLPETADD